MRSGMPIVPPPNVATNTCQRLLNIVETNAILPPSGAQRASRCTLPSSMSARSAPVRRSSTRSWIASF
jgi:hypothetical protein